MNGPDHGAGSVPTSCAITGGVWKAIDDIAKIEHKIRTSRMGGVLLEC